MNGRAPGVRILGTGSCLPSRRVTNADLEQVMDTSDEWITKRTGIRERRVCDLEKGESTRTIAAGALTRAFDDAGVPTRDVDLLICATMTPENPCPPVACRIADMIGATAAGAFDLNGACSGFIFGINTAHALIQQGVVRTAAIVGVDTLSTVLEFSTRHRSTSILFGDGAGAAVIQASADPSMGIIASTIHADGGAWSDIHVPTSLHDWPEGEEPVPEMHGLVQMRGQAVFKFAVKKFPELIEETLDKAGVNAADVDMFVCHQSNARILDAARERFGLDPERLYVNIDRIGNTSAGSVPICLDELRRAGRIKAGQKVMMVGFGAGLTWGSCLWQL